VRVDRWFFIEVRNRTYLRIKSFLLTRRERYFFLIIHHAVVVGTLEGLLLVSCEHGKLKTKLLAQQLEMFLVKVPFFPHTINFLAAFILTNILRDGFYFDMALCKVVP